METQTQRFKIRLGLFIVGGLTLFVVAIFIIGKQKNMFNPVFEITSTFTNVSGLQVGNNVRFSGINVGTVNNIIIINDTSVRVDMVIKKEVSQFIKTDCKVTLGTEGIIGDKLIIIIQGSPDAPLLKDGQSLSSIEPIETSVIMARLDVTTKNVENVSKQLSQISFDINQGHGTISRLIQDSIFAENLNQTIVNLKKFTKGLTGSDEVMASLKVTARNAETFSYQLAAIMKKINKGDGTLGRLIQDSGMADNLNQTILNLKKSSKGLAGTDTIMAKLNATVGNAAIISKQLTEMMTKINKGNGTLSRLIRDTTLAGNLDETLINLKKSSEGLDENMTALKHTFLLRGYFKRKAREEAAKKKGLEKRIKRKFDN
jgi:phospholipid/cholesterol/gamma-HCH transport system substrate-binding protein